ncbi:hypothetical protein [Streptomyces sp. NPDC006285]|uniref:hypothetical protein n=1 Tax=Streptomyces sp. NPDC006285 TaxID=3364742 RepID=UPI0036B3479E
MRLSADPNITSYRELEALPTDPDALLEKVYDDTKDNGSINRGAALEMIGDMLDDATLLPEVNAALYRAAAKIPGVSVVERAEDIAGRPTRPQGPDRARCGPGPAAVRCRPAAAVRQLCPVSSPACSVASDAPVFSRILRTSSAFWSAAP